MKDIEKNKVLKDITIFMIYLLVIFIVACIITYFNLFSISDTYNIKNVFSSEFLKLFFDIQLRTFGIYLVYKFTKMIYKSIIYYKNFKK